MRSVTNPRALFITSRYPFGVSGGDHERARQLIVHLKTTGYSIDLISLSDSRLDHLIFDKNIQKQSIFSHSGSFSKLSAVASSFTMMRPLQVGYYNNFQTSRLLAKLDTSPYEIVLIHLARLYPIYLSAPESEKHKFVIDLCDILTLNYKRSWRSRANSFPWRCISFIEYILMKSYEKKIMASSVKKILISNRDLKFAREQFKQVNNTFFLPNYIGSFHSSGNNNRLTSSSSKPCNICFIGNMLASHNSASISYLLSVGFANLLHMVGVNLVVAGRMSTQQIHYYESHNIIVRPNPVSIDEAVADCFCGLAYLDFCAGLQNKLLDYIRLGLPVISSKYCADGMELIPDIHYLMAKNVADIIKHINALKSDTQLGLFFADNARNYALQLFSKDRVSCAFKSIISSSSVH